MVFGQLLSNLSDALIGMPEPQALFRCAEVLESILHPIKLPTCPMTKPTEGAVSAEDGTSSERVQTDAGSAGSETKPSSKAVSQAVHDDAWSDSTLPLMIGILPLGFILGTQGAQHGLSAIGMAIMCAFNFAGGSEFAAVALWSSAPSFIVIVCATWLINCRHIVLGAALTPFMQSAKVSTPRSLLAFFVMCDETWALSMQEVHRRSKAGRPAAELFSFSYHMGVGVTLWTSWFMIAAIGAAVGGSLGDLTRCHLHRSRGRDAAGAFQIRPDGRLGTRRRRIEPLSAASLEHSARHHYRSGSGSGKRIRRMHRCPIRFALFSPCRRFRNSSLSAACCSPPTPHALSAGWCFAVIRCRRACSAFWMPRPAA